MSFPNDDRFTRRGFLEAGAAVTLGLTGLPAMLHAKEAKAETSSKGKGPYGDFTVGAQSYCFREFNTEQALKRIKELGLRYVEFFQKHAPLTQDAGQIKALLKLCKEYDVTPIAWGVQDFTKDHDANKKIFEFGKALGVRTFSANPEPDSFDSLDKLVAEYKIAIAIHPHGPQGDKLHRWYSAEKIMAAVKDHNPLIGSCLDTGHLIRCNQPPFNIKLDPAKEVRVMGARNFGMHLKDHDNKKHTDVIYGKGVLDVPAVLRALRDVKFKGYISIEYEAHPDNPVPDMRACLDVLKTSIKNLA
jgi:sugar phosphate isomerase/epimerase